MCVCDPGRGPKVQWQWRLLRPHPLANSITSMGLGTISTILRGSSLPWPSMLGHRPSTLTALCSWAWRLLLKQIPSAWPPATSALLVGPARSPARPGSTAVTPHLSMPSQDGICQLPVLSLLFLHTEPQGSHCYREKGTAVRHRSSSWIPLRRQAGFLRSLPSSALNPRRSTQLPGSPLLLH